MGVGQRLGKRQKLDKDLLESAAKRLERQLPTVSSANLERRTECFLNPLGVLSHVHLVKSPEKTHGMGGAKL